MPKKYLSNTNEQHELKLLTLMTSTWVSKIMDFAYRHDILSRLYRQQTVRDIARAISIDEFKLNRVISALEHLELIDENRELTKMALMLVPQSQEKSMYNMGKLWVECFNQAWNFFDEVVNSDKTGFELSTGSTIFEWMGKHPEIGLCFDRAMQEITMLYADDLVKSMSFSHGQKVVDCGGGNGFLIKEIANQHNVQGVLFDLPHVVSRAAALNMNDSSEIELISGDFFENVPIGDVHILANVLHDWSDDDSLRILQSIRRGQQINGRLYLIEMLVGHEDEPWLARSTDLNMMVLTGGRERSLSELNALLRKAGFYFKHVENINNLTCLVEAVAV
jgi:ubiquinone/menaquinone biosynthesis C-methylase UbiE